MEEPLRGLEIDLNCDLGESFGTYDIGQDAQVLPHVTSANIACGFHAGDPAVMRRTVRLCVEHGVAIGAHPGLPDLQGFGRREMGIAPEEVYEFMLYQIGALDAFVRVEGAKLHHVKPHGALYNMAARDERLAEAVAAAVFRYDPSLKLYGLSGSKLILAGRSLGLDSVSEVFADRSYGPDGRLTPRSDPRALLHDEEAAVAQALHMAVHGEVTAVDGSQVPVAVQTVCIHGDNPRAPLFAAKLHAALAARGIRIAAPGI